MVKNYVIVDRNRASNSTRVANYLIDLIVFYIFIFIFGIGLGLLYSLTQSSFLGNFLDTLSGLNSLVDRMITLIFYGLYMFVVEWALKGRSIGKFITGTKVVNMDNRPLTVSDYFVRNISRAVPFDSFSFFGSLGWHDKWSDTRVVNLNNFEAELMRNKEIDEIGQVAI